MQNEIMNNKDLIKLVEKYRKEVYAWQFSMGIGAYLKSVDISKYHENWDNVFNYSSAMNKYLNKITKEFGPEVANEINIKINEEIKMFRDQCAISAEYWKAGN